MVELKILVALAVLSVFQLVTADSGQGIVTVESKTFEFKHRNRQTSTETFSFGNQDVLLSSVEMTAVIGDQMINPQISFDDVEDVQSDGTGGGICLKYARTLYNFDYLKKAEEATQQVMRKAASLLSVGYQNLMTFKRSDGAFFSSDSSSPSTWLSAYTAKVLGHANRMNVKPDSPKTIKNALNYIVKNQNEDGSFEEIGFSRMPSSSISENPDSRKACFTCFVLIALVENYPLLSEEQKEAIEKGFQYVQSTTSRNNYFTAVCGLAFARYGKTTEAKLFLSFLEQNQEGDGNIKHWDFNKDIITPTPFKITISSYAALTYVELGEEQKAKPIINWLLTMRDENNNFGGTFSTAMVYEVFAAIGKFVTPKNTKMNIKIMNEDGDVHYEEMITGVNALEPILLQPLPKGSSAIKIEAKGIGYAQVQAFFVYQQNIEGTLDAFKLKVKGVVNENEDGVKHVRVCASTNSHYEDYDDDKMIVMQFILPEGYVYLRKSAPNVKKVDLLRAGTVVQLYLDALNEEFCPLIYFRKTHDVENPKLGSVSVFEYDRPTETGTTRFFGLGDMRYRVNF